MQNKSANHEESRLKICAPCRKKITYKINPQMFAIAEKIIEQMKLRINSFFDISNSIYHIWHISSQYM